jgi:type VI secretion system protein ImpG
MDTRLLGHYENELNYLRDMGAEFAAAYPKIASRLGMEGVEVLDPYVERLLEGVAFLSARVQLELELQYPNFTSNLLEIIYPHYLAPTPSMMIAHFEPDPTNSAVKSGYLMPRGSVLRSRLDEGAQYIDGRGDLVAAGVATGYEARAGIRLRLKRSDGEPLRDLDMDRLQIYLGSAAGNSWPLLELLCTQVQGIVARSTDRRADWQLPLPEGRIVQKGFSREEALLPVPARVFDGYRLLQEFFAMPERFRLVELQGLRPALQKAEGSEVDLYIPLREGMRDVAQVVLPEVFQLNTIPAVNLFEKRCDRVRLTVRDTEHQVVPNRTAGLDFEIYALKKVTGISGEGADDVEFRPFYSANDFTAAGETHPAYYTLKRRMRERSEKERLRGVRSSYLGSEVYLTLVDRSQAPYGADLEQLAVQALCTNRDLPLLLATGNENVFHLPEGGPVKQITLPISPTRPHPSLGQGDTAWRLISHLSLNYVSIADSSRGNAAEALRELVGLYAPLGNRVTEKQLEGIVSVSSRPIVRRMSDEILSTAVRGMEISIGFDESFFEGSNIYALGAVLERFFHGYANINSFTETVLTTEKRGEIARWRPHKGLGRMI